jgi:deazaflavin-dependent oxidoreductase (nitroreductase family)
MKHYKGPWGWLTATFPPAKPGGLAWKIEGAVTRAHVRIFQRTRGRILGSFDGAPLLVLHHIGAKSGVLRQSPMIYLPDGDNLVVVASIGGNPKNPAWYYNLRANPEKVEVDVRGGRRRVRARQAAPEEADALWPRLVAMWPAWKTYMTRTDRKFPVMILEPR